MEKEKTIEELEKELEEMKSFHMSSWETYGSRLCAGDMLKQEDELLKKIQRSKELLKLRENGLIDEKNNLIPSVSLTGKTGQSGIEYLRKHRDETIERWNKMGLLEGLEGNIQGNSARIFDSYYVQFIDNERISDLKSISNAITESCRLLQSIDITDCKEIIDEYKLHDINMQLSEWVHKLNKGL